MDGALRDGVQQSLGQAKALFRAVKRFVQLRYCPIAVCRRVQRFEGKYPRGYKQCNSAVRPAHAANLPPATGRFFVAKVNLPALDGQRLKSLRRNSGASVHGVRGAGAGLNWFLMGLSQWVVAQSAAASRGMYVFAIP